MGNPLPPRQSRAQERAAELRRDLTPAERQLWSLLRAKRLGGLKFRRQVAIGPFIADFSATSNNWLSNWMEFRTKFASSSMRIGRGTLNLCSCAYCGSTTKTY